MMQKAFIKFPTKLKVFVTILIEKEKRLIIYCEISLSLAKMALDNEERNRNDRLQFICGLMNIRFKYMAIMTINTIG